MAENETAAAILDVAFEIHTRLGPGLLESVYENILSFELNRRGLASRQQVTVPLVWKGMLMKEAFRADLVVSDEVLVEIKSVERLIPAHKKQLLTYLKITTMKLGLVINFGAPVLREGIERIVNGL